MTVIGASLEETQSAKDFLSASWVIQRGPVDGHTRSPGRNPSRVNACRLRPGVHAVALLLYPARRPVSAA